MIGHPSTEAIACAAFRCALPDNHHGPHKQADGRYFGSTHHGICEGCMLDAIAMLERIEATGDPEGHSINAARVRSGEWTADDVRAWATRRLSDTRAELEILRRRRQS